MKQNPTQGIALYDVHPLLAEVTYVDCWGSAKDQWLGILQNHTALNALVHTSHSNDRIVHNKKVKFFRNIICLAHMVTPIDILLHQKYTGASALLMVTKCLLTSQLSLVLIAPELVTVVPIIFKKKNKSIPDTVEQRKYR